MTKDEILKIPKLGFGLMRLPMNGEDVDLEQTCKMVDLFLEKGYKYFDTAYVYISGKSEEAVKEALVKRHPRDSFYIATKLPSWNLNSAADADRIFNEQLERTGAGYFDFYLLHNMSSGTIDDFEKVDCWKWAMEKKEKGLIKNFGFSCHDGPEFLDKVLTAHPEVDFVQLQVNYADWEASNVQSGACYDMVVKHGRPVIIMEPVKGGTLSSLRPELEDVFKKADPDASVASWAFKFVSSLPGAAVILSGMSNVEQVEDNLNTFSKLKPLTQDEKNVIENVREIMAKADTVPCTACKYCVDGCPMNIDIPGIFRTYNNGKTYAFTERLTGEYDMRLKKHASDCIKCGQCESICPQHISVMDKLDEVAEKFGK